VTHPPIYRVGHFAHHHATVPFLRTLRHWSDSQEK
jgi:hypothetical protein